jgi:HEAT repeat protein
MAWVSLITRNRRRVGTSDTQTTVIDKLASSLKRRDEAPNVKLAQSIVKNDDEDAVVDLVENLANKDREVQSDCIKVLYEIGERKPALIARFAEEFGSLLDSKNNRLVWGAMTALDSIASEVPQAVHGTLPRIIDVANRGSVISRDHAVNILIRLAARKEYADDAFSLLVEQLRSSPGNQIPMYAEKAVPIVRGKDRDLFLRTLRGRLGDIQKESKRKRVERVMANLSQRPP